MTNRNTPLRSAGTAIAAFLVIGSTSAWAQEMPAPADATVAASAAQSVPTIVLPPVIAVQPAPVAEPAATVEDSSVPSTRNVRATRSVSTATPTAPARIVRSAVESTAPVAAEPTAPVAASAPVGSKAAPVEQTTAEPIAAAAPVGSTDSNDLLLAGLAGVLGLGAIGLFAATRRRRVELDDAVVEYEPVTAPAESILAPPTPSPLLTTPAFTPLAAWSEPHAPLAHPAETRALDLNRTALIARMVAAEPDANNPFVSRKARRRRARLMLQSLENNRWEDAELAPGFDWREMAQAVAERETVTA